MARYNGLASNFAPFLPLFAPFLEGQFFVQSGTKKGARLDKNFAQFCTFWKEVRRKFSCPISHLFCPISMKISCPISHLFHVQFLPNFAPFLKMLNMSKEAFVWVIELALKIPKKVWDWSFYWQNSFKKTIFNFRLPQGT